MSRAYPVTSMSVFTSPLSKSTYVIGPVSTTGDTFPNDGLTFLWIDVVTATTVTVKAKGTSPATPTGLGPIAITDFATSSLAVGQYVLGPFAPGRFNDTSGNVEVQWGVTTSNSVAAIRFVPIS